MGVGDIRVAVPLGGGRESDRALLPSGLEVRVYGAVAVFARGDGFVHQLHYIIVPADAERRDDFVLAFGESVLPPPLLRAISAKGAEHVRSGAGHPRSGAREEVVTSKADDRAQFRVGEFPHVARAHLPQRAVWVFLVEGVWSQRGCYRHLGFEQDFVLEERCGRQVSQRRSC